jgi:hypothetical protein
MGATLVSLESFSCRRWEPSIFFWFNLKRCYDCGVRGNLSFRQAEPVRVSRKSTVGPCHENSNMLTTRSTTLFAVSVRNRLWVLVMKILTFWPSVPLHVLCSPLPIPSRLPKSWWSPWPLRGPHSRACLGLWVPFSLWSSHTSCTALPFVRWNSYGFAFMKIDPCMWDSGNRQSIPCHESWWHFELRSDPSTNPYRPRQLHGLMLGITVSGTSFLLNTEEMLWL